VRFWIRGMRFMIYIFRLKINIVRLRIILAMTFEMWCHVVRLSTDEVGFFETSTTLQGVT
jgi:hypothetical protein